MGDAATLFQRLRPQRLQRAPGLAETLAREVPRRHDVLLRGEPKASPTGVLGRFELDDDAGESLRQGVMDVACDAIAFSRHGGFAALRRQLGQADHQHGLVGQRLGQFDLLGLEVPLALEAKSDGALQLPGDEQGQQKNGDDAQRQQPIAQGEGRHGPDVLDHTGLPGAKHFRPRPYVFHRQREVQPGEAGSCVRHDPAVLEDELDPYRVVGQSPAPDTGAVRAELGGERAQGVRDQQAGFRLVGQGIQRTLERVDLSPDQLLGRQQGILGAFARLDIGVGAVPLQNPARVVPQRGVAKEKPAVFTVEAPDPRFQFARRALRQCLLPLRLQTRHVVRMDGDRPSPAHGIIHGYPGVIAPLLVEELDRPVGTAEPGQSGDGVDRDAEAFLPGSKIAVERCARVARHFTRMLAHRGTPSVGTPVDRRSGAIAATGTTEIPEIRADFRCCAIRPT